MRELTNRARPGSSAVRRDAGGSLRAETTTGVELLSRGYEPHTEQIGDYRLLGCLADGVTGTTYLAASDQTDSSPPFVVANRVRTVGRNASNLAAALRNEARLAASLQHPNLVRTLGVVEHKGNLYWLTEYVDGQAFDKLVRGSRIAPQVSLRVRLTVLRDALAGLHAAHQLRDRHGRCLNVVHTGVRPSNLIVSYAGEVKVVGFGIARVLTRGAHWRDVPGGLRYAAPEQLTGEELDLRADVFAMGVMLWESISLRKFASNYARERQVVERRLRGEEPRIAQVTPQISTQLARICDKALSVDRKQRFQSAEEFREALDEYMARSGAPCRPSTLGQLVSKKFEAERLAVARLVARETRLRDEPRTAVGVRRARPADDDGDVTVIYEGPLVEESRVVTGRPSPASINGNARLGTALARPWLWALLLGALLAALACAAWWL